MAKQSTRRIVLIRSCRTAWDEAGRVQGRTDLPATDEALCELEPVLDRWAAGEDDLPGLVFSADDEGCRATASIAASVFAAKVKQVEGLEAMGMGLWEGLTEEDLEDRHPTNYRRWREHPAAVNVPEGEGVRPFEERVLLQLIRLLERHPKKDVAVVLRPLEYRILDSVLSSGEAIGDLSADELEQGEQVSSHEVDLDALRRLAEGMRASV